LGFSDGYSINYFGWGKQTVVVLSGGFVGLALLTLSDKTRVVKSIFFDQWVKCPQQKNL
jgi:hypothetical protein